MLISGVPMTEQGYRKEHDNLSRQSSFNPILATGSPRKPQLKGSKRW